LEKSTKNTEDIELDLGNMCAFDIHPLDPQKSIGKSREKYLFERTTENTKKLLTEIFSLEILDDQETGESVKLPVPTSFLPREKSPPKPKAETKWEKFAKEKGIGKHKRERMIFDEESGEYKPRYGYKRAKDDQKDWLIEERPGEDFRGAEDPFQARAEAKKKRVEEQKKKRKKKSRTRRTIQTSTFR